MNKHTISRFSLRSLQPSKRRWLLRAGIGVVAFILFAIINEMLPEQHPANVVSPVPSPRTDVGFFYFQELPTWGTVLIDGQALQQTPTIGTAAPIAIARGQHQLVWKAEPFQPFQCILQVPPMSGTQDCQTRKGLSLWEGNTTFIVQLPISLNLLPEQERTALTRATQATLDSREMSETIQAGDHYAFQEDTSRVLTTREPLQATFRFLLHTAMATPAHCIAPSLDQGCTIAGQDCRTFCTLDQWPISQPAIPQWNIAAVFHETWQYTTSDGQLIKSDAPAPFPKQHTDQLVTLRVSWSQGHWSVTFHPAKDSAFDDPGCIMMVSAITTHASYYQPYGSNQPVSWAYASDFQNTASCLAAGYVRASASASLPAKPSLLLLRRYGVIMTANEAAHRLWPDLLAASEHEQQIAQKLLEKISL